MRGAMLLRQKMNVMSRGGVTCLLAAAMSCQLKVILNFV